MDFIGSASALLCDELLTKPTSSHRHIVEQYIEKVETEINLREVNFPPGLTWFGVRQPLTTEDLKGRITILDFFTYCCINCVHVVSQLKEIERHIKPKVLMLIGIHSPKFENEKKDSCVEQAIEKMGIDHPVLHDPDTIMWNEYEINCWPTLIVLGPTARPLLILVGEDHQKELESFINAAILHYASLLYDSNISVSRHFGTVRDTVLTYPNKITASPDGSLFAISCHHRVLIVHSSGTIAHMIGSHVSGFDDGPFSSARFFDPQGMAFHGEDHLYVADTGNHTIRLVDLKTLNVTTVTGNRKQGENVIGGRKGEHQDICSPWGLCIAQIVEKIPEFPMPVSNRPDSCFPSTFSSPSETGIPPPPKQSQASYISPPDSSRDDMSQRLNFFIGQGSPRSTVSSIPPPPIRPSQASTIRSDDRKKEVLLIGMSGIHQIWAYFLEDTIWWKGRLFEQGSCHAIAGNGTEGNKNNMYPLSATFAQPSGICFCADLYCIFIADSESSAIRKMCLATGVVSAVVGGHANPTNLFSFGDVDGDGTNAKLQHPLDVSWDHNRQILYVADTYNHKLKEVDVIKRSCKSIHLHKGLSEPGGLLVVQDSIYIADTNNHRIAIFDQVTRMVDEFVIIPKNKKCETKSRKQWVAEASVPVGDDEFIISVELPPSSSGRWQSVEGYDDILLKRDGNIIDGSMKIVLRKRIAYELKFDIDFAMCEADACHMCYYRLFLKINLNKDGKEENSISVKPKLKP